MRTEPASGVVNVSEPVVWQVEWKGDDWPLEVQYLLERGRQVEVASGTLSLVDGRAEMKSSLDKPGTLLAHFAAKSAAGKEEKALGGAIVAPAKVEASAPRPDDFDAFWDAKIAEIQAVPANAVLEPGESGRDGVEYWKITLDGYGGTKIRGQLARPRVAKETALPTKIAVANCRLCSFLSGPESIQSRRRGRSTGRRRAGWC